MRVLKLLAGAEGTTQWVTRNRPAPFQPTFGGGIFDAFVTKITPAATIGALISQVATLNLNAGQKNSLTSKLDAAQQSLAKGNDTAAINQLNAFVHEVRALKRSGRLDATTADGLIAQAQAIISQL